MSAGINSIFTGFVITITIEMDASELKPKSRTKHAIVIIFIGIAISASLMDVAIDAFAYHYGSFWDVFVSSSPGIIFGRIYIFVSFTVIGIFVNLYMRTRARLIEQLNEANSQVQKYAGQLETKVEEGTRDLADAQNKLLKTERLAAIGELAGMVGHDLRNPLTGIAGAAYYLKTKYDSNIDEKGKEMVEIIEKAVAYSDKIISDLLDYSREIKLELTETTPKSMLKEAYSSLEIPQNVRLQDETEDKPRMKADVPRMKRVFINIIKNALDAMPNDGVLTIRSEEKEKHVSFSFTDTGTGMSEEARVKLWTPLFTTKAKGMGFGLPICKRIVETHGGTISVESTVGKGTTFRINVPIEPRTEKTKDVWVNLPETIQLAKEDNASRARF